MCVILEAFRISLRTCLRLRDCSHYDYEESAPTTTHLIDERVMENSSILMYADDTVMYVAGKEIDSIENNLSKDMDNLSELLRCNELILNLKKGKTESILFGTAQRITKQRNEPLKVTISHPTPAVINNTTVDKYLGVVVDTTLNLDSHFDKCSGVQLGDCDYWQN